jgi:hypothetical protein
MSEADEEDWNGLIGHLDREAASIFPRRPISVAAKRRWFSFSLRTLFVVVTGVCLWLSLNIYQVRQRREAIEYIKAKGGGMWSLPPRRSTRAKTYPADHLPLVWRLLGAEPVGTIQLYFPLFTEGDRERIAPLFPEADVSIPPHGGTGIM